MGQTAFIGEIHRTCDYDFENNAIHSAQQIVRMRNAKSPYQLTLSTDQTPYIRSGSTIAMALGGRAIRGLPGSKYIITDQTEHEYFDKHPIAATTLSLRQLVFNETDFNATRTFGTWEAPPTGVAVYSKWQGEVSKSVNIDWAASDATGLKTQTILKIDRWCTVQHIQSEQGNFMEVIGGGDTINRAIRMAGIEPTPYIWWYSAGVKQEAPAVEIHFSDNSIERYNRYVCIAESLVSDGIGQNTVTIRQTWQMVLPWYTTEAPV